MSLLANVLAVALGALFNESPVTVAHNMTVLQLHASVITPTAFIADIGFPLGYDHFYVTAANLSLGTQLTPWTDAEFAYLPFSTAIETGSSSSSLYRARTKGFGVDVACLPLSTSAESMPRVEYSLGYDGSQDINALFRTTNGSVASCRTIRGLYRSGWLNASETPVPGMLAQELVSSLYPQGFYINNTEYLPDDGGICDRKQILSWMRIDPAKRNESQSAIHMYCVPSWRSADFDVTVDPEGYVLDATRVGEYDDIGDSTRIQTESVLTEMIAVIGAGVAVMSSLSMSGPLDDDGWHNDTLTRDWMNHLLKLKLNTTRLLDSSQPVPNFDSIHTPVEDLYKMLIANMIGSHVSSLFEASASPAQLSGTQFVPEIRIFMDETPFIITIAILGLMVIVATTLYIRESRPFLPRLPSTIGSLLAYVAASQAVEEYSERENAARNKRDSTRTRATYSFGEFLGKDGKYHVGIELDPFVKPWDDKGFVRFRQWLRRRT